MKKIFVLGMIIVIRNVERRLENSKKGWWWKVPSVILMALIVILGVFSVFAQFDSRTVPEDNFVHNNKTKFTYFEWDTEGIQIFNKRFQIRTKDLQHAFYILTPHFMEYIIKADDLSDARMYFAFIENRIHILLGSEKNLFETTKKRSIRHCCCSCAC